MAILCAPHTLRMGGGRLAVQTHEVVGIPAANRSTTRIRRIELFRVRVPLKKEIKHASHSRTESENLVVRVELANGQAGHGEGVPRSYVTGETIESTFATLARYDTRAISPRWCGAWNR